MSIEQMNKSELVKEVRRLTQENKLLEAENKDLANATNSAVESVLATTEELVAATKVELDSLPYLAVSIIKKDNNNHRVLQIRFDLDGNAKVDFSKDKVLKEGYRASYEAAKLMETIVAIQEEPKVGV
jgi:DNA-directed RNA polymerase specialized sigma54-like protein